MASSLPDDDPKLDSLLKIVSETIHSEGARQSSYILLLPSYTFLFGKAFTKREDTV